MTVSREKTNRHRYSLCVVSEGLTFPADEGIRHFAVSLLRCWAREHRVLGISARKRGRPAVPHTIAFEVNRLFLSWRLFSVLRRFKPEIIFYIPTASATLFSFLRLRLLRCYYPAARAVMVALQPRQHTALAKLFIRHLRPDMVFVQSEVMLLRLAALGLRVALLPSGVDLKVFTPASPARRRELRATYGLDPDAFIVLHVGHVTSGRNIAVLEDIRQRHDCQVVLVASSLIHDDRHALLGWLQEKGIRVIDRYLERMEEIYQLADCYLFPVVSERSCIGVPLSVLEAMACNLPVVTTRYGLLPRLFEEGEGLFFADSPGEMVEAVALARDTDGIMTRKKVMPYSWENIAGEILEKMMAEDGR